MNRTPRQRGPMGRSLLPGNRHETEPAEGEGKPADTGEAVQGRRTINKGGK